MKLLITLFDSLREFNEVRCCRTGPYTIGGRMTESVNLGDSSSQNFHAAFSAKVLLAAANSQRSSTRQAQFGVLNLPAYPALASLKACSKVIGFQSISS